jgi:hypothetical protein
MSLEHTGMPELSTAPTRIRDASGRLRVVDIAEYFRPEPSAGVLPVCMVLPVRMVMVEGRVLLQKRVPRERPELFEALDREIRALTRFAQVFDGHRYPDELPQIYGYDVDSDSPLVLLEPYRGDCARDYLNRLQHSERAQFQNSALRALRAITAAGMVHGSVELGSMRWDSHDRTVQLVNFENSARIGEPQRQCGPGSVDERDDLPGLGAALYEITTGDRTTTPLTGIVEAPEALRVLLDGFFAPCIEHRPTVAAVLARRKIGAEIYPNDMGMPLAPGHQKYDEILKGKRRRAAERSSLSEKTDPRSSRWWLAGTVVMVLVVSLLVILAVVRP